MRMLAISLAVFLRLFTGITKQGTLWKITTISNQGCSHSSLRCSNWFLNSRDLSVSYHIKKTEVRNRNLLPTCCRNRTFYPPGHFLGGRQIAFIKHHNTWTQAKVHLQNKSFRESTKAMWRLGSRVGGLDLEMDQKRLDMRAPAGT